LIHPAPILNPLVFLGHPGHELRILGWLGKVRPPVWVMTDGSGSTGRPRTERSRAVLEKTGCAIGPMFGRYSDRVIHDALLNGDTAFFLRLTAELVAAIRSGEHDGVIYDGAEGYNPSHDLVNMMAVAATKRTGVPLYDFPLVGDPNGPLERRTERSILYQLNDDELAEKVQTAINYAQSVGATLLEEVKDSLAKFTPELFRRERLLPVEISDYEQRFESSKPYYELRGEERLASGHYSSVIRLKEHLAPIVRALQHNQSTTG